MDDNFDSHILLEIGEGIICDIPIDLSDLEKERQLKEFINEYTLGLNPKEVFHESNIEADDYQIIRTQSDYDIHKLDVVYMLPNNLHRRDVRPLIEKLNNSFSSLKKGRMERLTLFENWLEYYYDYRISKDFTNGLINKELGKRTLTKLKDWSKNKRIEFSKSLIGEGLAKFVLNHYGKEIQELSKESMRAFSIKCESELFIDLPINAETIRAALRRLKKKELTK
jgi:hypothetical protein